MNNSLMVRFLDFSSWNYQAFDLFACNFCGFKMAAKIPHIPPKLCDIKQLHNDDSPNMVLLYHCCLANYHNFHFIWDCSMFCPICHVDRAIAATKSTPSGRGAGVHSCGNFVWMSFKHIYFLLIKFFTFLVIRRSYLESLHIKIKLLFYFKFTLTYVFLH